MAPIPWPEQTGLTMRRPMDRVRTQRLDARSEIANPPPLPSNGHPVHAAILRLQRLAGNHAVSRLCAGRAPATGPHQHVQRAVGFEFEAGSLDSKRQKSGAMQPLKRKDVILASPPLFTMEADEKESGGSDVEFVTSPFPE